MAVNKVVDVGGNTLVDLTGDTVTPETLAEGVTAHNSAGVQITGTMPDGGGGGGGVTIILGNWPYNNDAPSFTFYPKTYGDDKYCIVYKGSNLEIVASELVGAKLNQIEVYDPYDSDFNYIYLNGSKVHAGSGQINSETVLQSGDKLELDIGNYP